MKSEYIVVYENRSDEFDIELRRIKVKVTVGVQKLSPITTIQTVRSDLLRPVSTGRYTVFCDPSQWGALLYLLLKWPLSCLL